MKEFYCVKSVTEFIHPQDGEPDSIIQAMVLIEEAETLPKNSIITIGQFQESRNYFENYGMAVGFADLREPGYSHDLRKAATR